MSSCVAQNRHFGGMKNYRTSEGREKLIPYTGSVKDVIEDILGGMEIDEEVVESEYKWGDVDVQTTERGTIYDADAS